MVDSKVNGVRSDKIEFRRDPKYLVRPKMMRGLEEDDEEMEDA